MVEDGLAVDEEIQTMMMFNIRRMRRERNRYDEGQRKRCKEGGWVDSAVD